MKTVITEYKPRGIWLIVGLAALVMLPVHLWVLYKAIWEEYGYQSWFFSPLLAVAGVIFEPIIVFYLLMTVQVVVKPKVVHKRWVFFGMVFDGEEVVIWEPESISLKKQRFIKYKPTVQNTYRAYTEFYIDAHYEAKSKQIFKYRADTDARHIAAEIAKALDVPFEDYS
ncbi:hypothetical protein ACLI09_07495 [Flavobacterium sp. RHBU_24]|uniref:hypothetical protein n=1 Tax=Flavobacterium sp. RHBU_24 TaxID=3391185 RepID=UPI003984AA4B